jgi:hypothetical protein
MKISRNLLILFVLVVVIAIFIKLSYNNKIVESYKDGSPLIFPSNYCSNKTSVGPCSTNWKTDGYVLGLTNNNISVAGNPCTWDNSACSVSADASGWNYQFTAAPQ